MGAVLGLLVAFSLLAGSGAAMLLAPDLTMSLRVIIKGTAWLSGLLFLLAFVAAPWARLSVLGQRLLRVRRWCGLSFALSHFVHGVALIALWQSDAPIFWSLTNPVNVVTGGIGYGFIVLMAATSFPAAQAWAGWAWLHRVGVWYLWLGFCVGFAKRLPQGLIYALPVLLLLGGVALRIWAQRRRSS